MGLLKLLLALVVVASVAAFFTRPGPEAVDTALREALYQKLFTEDIDEGRDMLGNAAILGCRLDPKSCFEILRSGLDVAYDDKLLYAQVTVTGFNRHAECYGAFTRFWCPGGFEKTPRT